MKKEEVFAAALGLKSPWYIAVTPNFWTIVQSGNINYFSHLKQSKMAKKRRNFSSKFKAKVALEAIRERHTLAELAQKYELHPNQIANWKKQLLEECSSLFEKKRGPARSEDKEKEARLYQQIGQLQFELDWLKKKYEQLS